MHMAYHPATRRLCGVFCFTAAASFALHPWGAICVRSPRRIRVTSSASPKRSARRSNARPPPRTASGSGATSSVHCRGIERNLSPSTRRSSRLPYLLYRWPTHSSCLPARGWNGCVTRTRRVAPTAVDAFRSELQAARARTFSGSSTRRGGGPRRARPHATCNAARRLRSAHGPYPGVGARVWAASRRIALQERTKRFRSLTRTVSKGDRHAAPAVIKDGC